MRAIVIIGAFFVSAIFWVIWQDLVEPSGLTHLIGIVIAVGFFFWVWDWSKRFSKPGKDNEQQPDERAGNKPPKSRSAIASNEDSGKVQPQLPNLTSHNPERKKYNSLIKVDIAVIAGFILVIAIVVFIQMATSERPAETTATHPTASQLGSDILSWESNDPRVINALKQWAQVGDDEAQFNMGIRYDHGEGVIQDYARAFCWYQHAAQRGHEIAMRKLGLMYLYGRGLEKNRVMAHKWYNLAAARGNEPARQYRLELANRMGQDEIERAQSLAREWQAEWEENLDPFAGPQYPSEIRYLESIPLPADDLERKYFCD